MFGFRKKRRALRTAGWGYTVLCGGIGLIYFSPVLWIILTSFKSRYDALARHQNYSLPQR